MSLLENCQLCPRKCGVNRYKRKGYCKAGFSDEEVPRTVFPTVVSRPMNKEFYIGYQVYDKINQIMKYPIEHGIVND